MRHSGSPARTQAQGARGLMTAGLTAGGGGEAEAAGPVGAGERGGLDLAFGGAPAGVVAFGHEQLGEESAVGQLLALGGVGDLAEAAADGGQPQDPAGLVNGSAGGVVGHAAAWCCHDTSPSRAGGGTGGAVRWVTGRPLRPAGDGWPALPRIPGRRTPVPLHTTVPHRPLRSPLALPPTLPHP